MNEFELIREILEDFHTRLCHLESESCSEGRTNDGALSRAFLDRLAKVIPHDIRPVS